jgi:hypothetical protein
MKRAATVTAALVLLGWLSPNAPAGRPAKKSPAKISPQAAAFFEKQVRPILAANCFRCHGPKVQKADLRLDSRAALLEGGESGPAVVPGNPDRSVLIRAVRYHDTVKMPPKGKLPDRAIQALTAWVKMGAPWPKHPVEGASQKRFSEWRKHWAFQPVGRPAFPRVKQADWPLTPIDAFVLAKLEARGMRPARPADRRTLLRRATFDLTGLPPTAAEIAAFEADQSPDAFARVVDRLLASPHYGERWGRHWLDVARYADTKGYVFTQARRFPYAYTYRDYVIRSLNEDLPYDRFVVDQLAADLLPRRGDNRHLAALGFLTVGRRFLNNPHDIIDDRIDVVTRGLLGLTVACARCHNHKFDPIPTKDYYSLYGVFASSVEPRELPLIGTAEPTPAYRAFQKELARREKIYTDFLHKIHAELVSKVQGQVPDYLMTVREIARAPRQGRRWLAAKGLHWLMLRRWQGYLQITRAKHDPIFAPWHAFAALPEKEFAAKAKDLAQAIAANADAKKPVNPVVARAFAGPPPRTLADVARKYGAVFAETRKLWQEELQLAALQKGKPMPKGLADRHREAIRRVLSAPNFPANVAVEQTWRLVGIDVRNKLVDLRRAVDQWISTSPAAPPRAMVLRDRPTPVAPHVLLRGNPNNPGPVVPRQFLEVLAGPKRQPFKHGSGRLDLARAIVDPKNPLTARVLVNRVWLHHFGAGLVRTPSDFGLRSDPPSHPELLDYLARSFMDDGWSIKKLHRRILLSRVYQQDSADDVRNRRLDPDNGLLWKMNRRRLDFEALRDSLLAASGRLDRRMNGRPEDLTTAPFTGRRTVYGFIDRQNLPGLFRTFDFASPDTSSPQRYTTTVPQQALFLLNSPFVVEQARALVRRPGFTALKSPSEQVQYLYRRLYGRRADREEMKLGLRFLAAARTPPRKGGRVDPKAAPPLSPWEKYAQVLLLANEFAFVD